MSEKVLTIIVPTYNRKATLARGVDAILPQVVKHRDEVALYISDNCSDDGTAGYIQSLHEKYPGLVEYKRQTKNIGAQLNFQDAVRSVKTKYAVLFSDDDIMLPNFVDTILAQLAVHGDIGLINYNALSVSPAGKYCGVRDPFVHCCIPKYYAQGGEFIKEHTNCPSLVSSNVFDRQAFVDQIAKVNVDDYPGYGWFAILLFSICQKPVLYIDQPLFLFCKPEIASWESRALEYCLCGLCHLFHDLDKEFPGIQKVWNDVFEHGWMKQSTLQLALKYQASYRDKFPLLKKYVPPEYAKELHGYLFRTRNQIKWANRWARIKRHIKRAFVVFS